MFATMILNIALMFVPGAQAAIVGQVGATIAKVGAFITETLTTVMKEVLQMGEDSVSAAMTVLKLMAKMILNPGFWLTITQVGLQTASTVVGYNMYKLQAQLAQMEGQLSAYVDQVDAVIEILKKIIQKLMDSLDQVAKDISATAAIIKNTFQNMSNTVTSLTAA